MDQLKKALAEIGKHQFWIVSALAVVLGVVGFYLTGSTLNKLYTDQATALDARFGDVTTVRSNIATHPNDISKEKMEVIISDIRDDVEAAWRSQYERQVNLLKWPEDDLKNKRLIEKLKKYSPIETTLTFPEEPAAIVKNDKVAYALYFADQMPAISQIIGCKWVGKASENASGMSGMGGMGGKGGMGGMGMGGMEGGTGGMGGSEMEGGMGSSGMGGMGGMGMGSNMVLKPADLVIWPKTSQDELMNTIRLWRGDSPTVYEILYTQENIWILEGLMRIIAKTNEGARANFQTAIKEIEFVRIGKPAVGRAGVIDSPMVASGMGMGPGGMGSAGMEGEMSSSMESSMEAMSSAAGGMMSEGGAEGAAGAMVMDPANGRYVDSTYAPLTGDDLRTKMQSESPEDAYFAVAKRVPVRLRFKMDQRKVPRFLAECGNADLMLEIRQVRLGNTVPAASGGMGSLGMGSMGSKGGMGMGMGGGMSTGGGGDGYGGSSSSSSEGMSGEGGMAGMGMGGMGGKGGGGMGGMMGMGMVTKPTWEMPVEIYGVVYLYNPVSIKRLGLDKVTESTEVADKVENPAAIAPVPEIVATESVPNANVGASNAAGQTAPPNAAADPANALPPAATDPANPAAKNAADNPNGAQPPPTTPQ